ncbi:TetR family transcriptional regulator [Rhodococcus hoagii]|nr:TetR family transcriptional regulator [Prescottella equi]
MSQGTPSTKQKLLEVAEELFATRGVEATLIGDIVQGAGQRNPSALRYHFGSREGVLQAIREKYLAELDRRRAELFEQWPGGDPSTPRDAVTLVVVPLVELLGSEGGRRYLRILGQTMYELNPDQMGAVAQYPSLARALDLMRGGWMKCLRISSKTGFGEPSSSSRRRSPLGLATRRGDGAHRTRFPTSAGT